MHRIRPQSYKIIAKNRAQLYRLTQKNEKYLQKHEKEGIFYSFFKRSKHQIIIFYSIAVLSCIFSAIYKTCLCYLCYESLHYLNEKWKEKKNGFSRNHEQKLARGAKKMCHRWHFSPLQKG